MKKEEIEKIWKNTTVPCNDNLEKDNIRLISYELFEMTLNMISRKSFLEGKKKAVEDYSKELKEVLNNG